MDLGSRFFFANVIMLVFFVLNYESGGNPRNIDEETVRNRFSQNVCTENNITVGRSYLNVEILINDCYFSRTQAFSSNGGVIYLSNLLPFNVTYCVFNNCSSSGSGGAIYCANLISEIRMICAYGCNATSCHFASISSKISRIDYATLTYCSKYLLGEQPITLWNGENRLSSSNFSKNLCKFDCGIRVYKTRDFLSNYCTFAWNNASSHICIMLWDYSGSFSFANIIGNWANSGFGLVRTYGSIYIFSDCIFSHNIGTLFYKESNDVLSLRHCTISHPSNSLTINSVSIIHNNTFGLISSYEYQYFASGVCHADNPIAQATPLDTPYRSYDFILQQFTLSNDIEVLKVISIFGSVLIQ